MRSRPATGPVRGVPAPRRRLRRGAVVALLVAGGLLSGCAAGGGDGSATIEAVDADGTPAARLAQAAGTVEAVQSGRLRMSVSYDVSIDGDPVSASLTAEGAFTDQGRRSEMVMDMTPMLVDFAEQTGESTPPFSMVVHVVQDGTRLFVKQETDPAFPGLDGWFESDLADVGVDAAQLENPAGLGGPTSFVESLRGAGADVAEAGRTTLDGVDVTTYEGTIDPETAIERTAPDHQREMREAMEASGLTEPYAFTAWVDDDGVLRKLRMIVVATTVSGEAMEMATEVDYFDLGADIDIPLPPEDQVRPASEAFDLSA